MESLTGVLIFAIAVFAVSAVMSILPSLITRMGEHVHRVLAISAGIMIGIVFLMILPEAFEESHEEAGLEPLFIFAILLVGFFVAFFLDMYVNHEGEHTHKATSMSAYGGMVIHAAFDGISLAAGFSAGDDVGALILVAVCVHKCAEVFSLSAALNVSMDSRKATRFMIGFSTVTPIAAILAYFLINGEPTLTGPAMMLSAGILLFVVMCDMLPEIYDHEDADSPNVRSAFLMIGVAVAVAAVIITELLTGGHGH